MDRLGAVHRGFDVSLRLPSSVQKNPSVGAVYLFLNRLVAAHRGGDVRYRTGHPFDINDSRLRADGDPDPRCIRRSSLPLHQEGV